MRISLSKAEIKRCNDFAYKCAENQQMIEFGQQDTVERSIREIGRDNLIGKIAETAFAKMLKNRYGISINLDFEFYPRGVWDKEDAVINGWSIDVKATRQGGKWLLIEWNKLNFRQRDDNLSHLYVMASVGWDRNIEQPTGTVELVGCVPLDHLRPGVKNTLVLRKGSNIPGTSTPLQADNYGIHFSNLITDWDRVINAINNNKPPNTENYPNPYTGQTTAEIERLR